MKKAQHLYWIAAVSVGLYLLFAFHNKPLDYAACKLCDGKEYLKLFWYFEIGETNQIAFPFYTRPLVPLLASMLPGSDPSFGFHFINAVFSLLSVLAILKLWQYLKLKSYTMWVGIGWLLLHWTGLIRYNLYDFVTVDVPIYFVQALALWLFFNQNHRWFYVLTPLALLQKESFLAIMLVFILMELIFENRKFISSGKHLLFSLVVGICVQKMALHFLPEQQDQRSSLMAILWHGKWALEDPTRFIRWFAAFGSAFGVIPFIIPTQFNKKLFKDKISLTLIVLSALYCTFGLLAGEDMTRIIFLGFPFIMTATLISFQKEHIWLLIAGLLLSVISLRLWPIPIDSEWAVDYRGLRYVYQWALFYLVALIAFFILHTISNKNFPFHDNLK